MEIYTDPDVLKIRQILEELEGDDMSKNARNLLIEYHNAISIGVCPNFIRTYNRKMAEAVVLDR